MTGSTGSDGGRDIEPLPCGRDPLTVVDRARDGHSDEHERSCPYCRAVAEADSPALAAARQLAELPGGATPDVPDTLVPAVMRTVWSELRRATMVPMPTAVGSSFVADHALAALVETALAGIADVQVQSCRVEIGSMPGAVTVAVIAAVAYGGDALALADDIRTEVGAELGRQFRLRTERVDVDVVDVFVDEAPVGEAASDASAAEAVR